MPLAFTPFVPGVLHLGCVGRVFVPLFVVPSDVFTVRLTHPRLGLSAAPLCFVFLAARSACRVGTWLLVFPLPALFLWVLRFGLVLPRVAPSRCSYLCRGGSYFCFLSFASFRVLACAEVSAGYGGSPALFSECLPSTLSWAPLIWWDGPPSAGWPPALWTFLFLLFRFSTALALSLLQGSHPIPRGPPLGVFTMYSRGPPLYPAFLAIRGLSACVCTLSCSLFFL